MKFPVARSRAADSLLFAEAIITDAITAATANTSNAATALVTLVLCLPTQRRARIKYGSCQA